MSSTLDSNPSTFQKIADQQEHAGHKTDTIIFHHTVNPLAAKEAVKGYMKLLNKLLHFKFPKDNSCIDLGCGAGYITKEFQKYGLKMKGLEKSDDALSAVKRHNPGLEILQGDMSSFLEPERYDFIFSREVYLITRVNAFTDQMKVISNVIDSLKSGGVFMLVASDVSFPHCADYDLIINTLKKDKRLKHVSRKYYEIIFSRLHKFIFGQTSYTIIEWFSKPIVYFFIKRKKKARSYIMSFVKR